MTQRCHSRSASTPAAALRGRCSAGRRCERRCLGALEGRVYDAGDRSLSEPFMARVTCWSRLRGSRWITPHSRLQLRLDGRGKVIERLAARVSARWAPEEVGPRLSGERSVSVRRTCREPRRREASVVGLMTLSMGLGSSICRRRWAWHAAVMLMLVPPRSRSAPRRLEKLRGRGPVSSRAPMSLPHRRKAWVKRQSAPTMRRPTGWWCC